MKFWTVLFCLIPFLFHCASTHEKDLVLPIDAQYASIFYAGYDNKSGVNVLPGWPQDTLKSRILMECFIRMDRQFRKELVKYTKSGGYTIANQEEGANIVIRLNYLPNHFQAHQLTLPLELRIKDLRTQQTTVRAYAAVGSQPVKPQPDAEINPYHYFGVLLSEVERNFPADRMVRLFYAHEPDGD